MEVIDESTKDKLAKIRQAGLTKAERDALVTSAEAGSVTSAASYLRVSHKAIWSARNRAFGKLRKVGLAVPDMRRAGDRGAIGRCRRGLLKSV